jgi:hypothetical protein
MKASRFDPHFCLAKPKRSPFCLFAIALALLTCVSRAKAAGDDFQMWVPVQIVHPFGEEWVASMQTEVRLKDDISEFGELVLKPALHYHLDESWVFSAGYKFIDKYQDSNEHDPWQEIGFSESFDDLVAGCQVRLEERLIEGIDGIIPRLRLLTHFSHPIGDSPHYVTGFGAVRFNLDDKGEGPVSGFEQSRISVALGHHFGDRVQFEVGYLWRYEEERTGEDQSDHDIHLQLILNTKRKPIRKPHPRDRYR